jgi:PmbA protein
VSLLQDDHAFELLGGLVEESPADETEATLECVEERFVRFAPSGPTQCADRERYELAVRVRFRDPSGGFREARATVGTLDREEARGALRRAVTLAQLAAPLTEAVPLEGPVEVVATAPQRPTQDHTFREKTQWVHRALLRAEAEGLLGAGLASTLVANRTLVNTAGRRVHAARSRASFQMTAVDAERRGDTLPGEGGPAALLPRTGSGGAGSAEEIAANVDHLDTEGVIERAIASATRSREPRPMVPRPLTVVLEPRAVAALLLFADFGAQEFVEGSSFLCGRIGERIFPESLRLVEEPEPGLDWVFDGEGAPVQRVELLKQGTFSGPLTDSRWAARLGQPNTGHARAQPSSDGPGARNLVLAPGDASLAELVEGVEDGLLVSQLHYVNVSEPRDLLLTGVTRGGTFRIERGRITHPVQNLRFTESFIDALARVSGVGAKCERAGALFEGECVVPALRIEGFRFTSASP